VLVTALFLLALAEIPRLRTRLRSASA
jgi:hypothetical protein